MDEIQLFSDTKLIFGAQQTPPDGTVEITYCLDGVREYMIDNSYYYITKGSYIVRRSVNCSISDSVDFSGITIVIDDKAATKSADDMLFDSRRFTDMVSRYEPYILSASSDISRLFSEIAKSFRSADTALLRIRAIESLMLISKNISGYANSSSEKAASAGAFICRNIGTHYTISQLSELFELNTTTLKAAFRRIFGCSIYAYAKNRKMFYAAVLLRDTDMKIIDIAEEAGYCNASKFSSAFSSVIGVSPSVYRRSFRMEQCKLTHSRTGNISKTITY